MAGTIEYTKKSVVVLNSIIEQYRNVNCVSDLKALGLSEHDYQCNEMSIALDGLRIMGKTRIQNENIMQWLERTGCKVEKTVDGWEIRL